MIQVVTDEEDANVGRWIPPHPDGRRPKYSPVYDRHYLSFNSFMVATKDIPKGGELFKPDSTDVSSQTWHTLNELLKVDEDCVWTSWAYRQSTLHSYNVILADGSIQYRKQTLDESSHERIMGTTNTKRCRSLTII